MTTGGKNCSVKLNPKSCVKLSPEEGDAKLRQEDFNAKFSPG